MATANRAPAAQKAVKYLDPTTLVSSHAVRFPPAKGKLIQGAKRAPDSDAALTWQKQETQRLRKALQHITHGKNIFAYNNIRTNQVVYSLSRHLDSKVLEQLIYHGKKTIPPKLRSDMWIPYFSAHFSSKTVGLNAYKLLVEFSRQRQLAPPPEMITLSEETLARKRPRDPMEAKKFDEEWESRMGRIMPKKLRARTLMDQKATSVADMAATISILEEKAKEEAPEEQQEGKKLSKRRRMKKRQAQKRQRKLELDIRKQIENLKTRLQTYFRGSPVELMEETLETANYGVQEGEVKIFWNDVHDAQFAAAWPEGVSHGKFDMYAEHIRRNRDGVPYLETPPKDSFSSSSGVPQEAESNQADAATETPAKKSREESHA